MLKKITLSVILIILFQTGIHAATILINVNSMTFSPANVSVNLGDTVKWKWVAGSHTTTSTTIPGGAASWNVNINSGATTYLYVPSTTGVYNYQCNFHVTMGMIGSFTVCSAPSVAIGTSDPTTFCSGSSANLLSTAIGFPLTYQWKKNGANISGATNSSYAATSTGSYSLIVTNACAVTASSASIAITSNPKPDATITAGGPVVFCAGDSVTLNAVFAASRSYQWKKSGVNISGATASSYVAKNSGTYKVTVTNTVTGCTKTTTTGIVVTKNALPAATITPQGPTTFCAGGSVLLAANTGAGLSYKWKRNGSYIGGAVNANYTATTAGNYKVEVTNSNGCSKTSAVVAVSVPCREGNNATETMVSPNPFSEYLKFSINSNESAEIILYDILLREYSHQYCEGSCTLDTREYAKGIYIYELRGKNGVITKGKVIKE